MALSLLDGTGASVDFTIGGSSVKCIFGYMAFAVGREMMEATTFCTSGWRSRTPGMKQAVVSLAGYASKGVTYSDPLTMMNNQTGLSFVATFDTSCSIAFTGHCVNDAQGIRAAGMSDRTISIESAGSVTSAWVTS